MAPVAAIVTKQSRDQRAGIGMINESPGAPVSISSIRSDGLFADSELAVGMEVLSINNVSTDGMTSGQAARMLKDAEGRVVLVADAPMQAAVVVATTTATATPPEFGRGRRGKERGYVILKKTSERGAGGVRTSATEKSCSFHGPMTVEMIAHVNDRLGGLNLRKGASRLRFALDDAGHYHGAMNRAAELYHEEDFVVVILEAMEELGYLFQFRYDAEATTARMRGDGYAAKELFIFHKLE